MRIFKKLFLACFAILLVLVGAWFVVPKDRIANEALKRAEAQIGRKITVAGRVDLGIFPTLFVRLGDVSVANADWSESEPMVQARELRLGVEMIPALKGDIKITELSLDQPNILLEVAKDGRANWEFSAQEPQNDVNAAAVNTQSSVNATSTTPSSATNSIAISLPEAKISDGTFQYIDHKTGQVVRLSNVSVHLKVPSMSQTAQINGSITFANGPISFDASIDTPDQFLKGNPASLSMITNTSAGQVVYKGDIAKDLKFSGNLALDINDTAGFASAFGVAMSVLPPNLGRSISGALTVSGTPSMIAVPKLDLALGKNAVSGGIDVSLDGKPNIAGQINLGDFDVRMGQTGPNPTSASSASSSGNVSSAPKTKSDWPTDRIDASGLNSVNAKVQVLANSVQTDVVAIGTINATATLVDGRLVADIANAKAYGGQAQGQAVVNARSGLSMAAKIAGAGFDIQGLLTDLIDQTKVQGNTNFNIDLLASGTSVDALMKSLSGVGQLDIKTGRWTGVDLDKILRSGQVEKGTTVFDDMSASFKVANGVVDNRDLKFTLPNFETTGAGQIDLGHRMIDYTITPKATKARDGQGISVPLRIQGSWDKPKLIPDMQAVIDQNLAKEKAAVVAKAKAKIDAEKKKLEQKVKDKLGVKTQKGQSIEDAVKQKLQNEAAKGLLNLLGKK